MEFARIQESFASKKISTKCYLKEKYPIDLSMYLEPPDERVNIDELGEAAIERVKLFRAFEIASVKVTKGISFKDVLIDEMTKQNLKYFMPIIKGFADAETRRRDHLSHFMLKICYCRSEEYMKWFLTRELEFFRLKFYNTERKEDITLFMKRSMLNYFPISDEEKFSLGSALCNSSFRYINLDVVNYYKVHFTEVLDLVRKRRVFIKSGNAYVPQNDLFSVLSNAFKKHLISELKEYSKNIAVYESDHRILAIVRGLHTCYTGKDYCTNYSNGVSRHNLDTLSEKSFPLCMKVMHETFKSSHHLRHYARLQYGLFLKGIGLKMDESLLFWKEGFTKKSDIDADIFEKRYAYSIRHSYGNEGKRANYTPHSCMKIINTNVGPGDNHGCPFKHYDGASLKKALFSCNLSSTDILGIVDYASRGHYQLACTKYFEVIHNKANVNGINHPNQYFEESQKILKPDNEHIETTEFNKNVNVLKNDKINIDEDEWLTDIDLPSVADIKNSENERPPQHT